MTGTQAPRGRRRAIPCMPSVNPGPSRPAPLAMFPAEISACIAPPAREPHTIRVIGSLTTTSFPLFTSHDFTDGRTTLKRVEGIHFPS